MCMRLKNSLPVLATLVLASCSPESYMDPIEPVAVNVSIGPSESAIAADEAAEHLVVLRLDVPHLWTGCHGEGRMTFHADGEMTWDLDGQTFGSPYLLDEEGRLYPGCAEDCTDMLPYRLDTDLGQWRQFDGYCWYALTPQP